MTIPVGENGIEYRGSGIEQEITGPSLLAIDPNDGVHIVDPVDVRILSFFDGTELSSIDLVPLDIYSVTAMAANDSHLVLVEIFFQPVHNRVHRLGYDGSLLETIELPLGFRLEDGLTGVRTGSDGEIVLEFENGAFFGVWDPVAESWEMADSIADGSVIPRPPDLEIDGVVLSADLTMGLGSMRYLGTSSDGVHLVVRDDVLGVDPAVEVLTTVEWYSPDGTLLGSARVPSLDEQYISTAPGIAMFPDGSAAALVALEDEVRVIVLEREPGRLTGRPAV